MGSLFTTVRRQRPHLDSSATDDESPHQPLLRRPSTSNPDNSSLWKCILSPLKYIIKLIKSILTTLFPSSPPYRLSIIQQSRLETLFDRTSVQYDKESPKHRDTLKKLWAAVFNSNSVDEISSISDSEISFALVSEKWKEMGWQGDDPSRDLRGGGYLSLECLVTFAEERTELFHRLLTKSQQQQAESDGNGNDIATMNNSSYNYYPFCAAGVNLVHMLVEVLYLRCGETSRVASTLAGRGFLERLRREDDALEQMFVEAFIEVDKQWELHGMEYMMFPMVLKKVKEEVIKRMEVEVRWQ